MLSKDQMFWVVFLTVLFTALSGTADMAKKGICCPPFPLPRDLKVGDT